MQTYWRCYVRHWAREKASRLNGPKRSYSHPCYQATKQYSSWPSRWTARPAVRRLEAAKRRIIPGLGVVAFKLGYARLQTAYAFFESSDLAACQLRQGLSCGGAQMPYNLA